MVLKECALLIEGDQLVEWVLVVGSLKGRISSVHHEEDDTKSEHIDDLWLVWPLEQELWGHVAHCADEAAREAGAFGATRRARKAKICDFEIVGLVYKDVLNFEITMAEAHRVHVVSCLDQL